MLVVFLLLVLLLQVRVLLLVSQELQVILELVFQLEHQLLL
jgi:hypothetical protein